MRSSISTLSRRFTSTLPTAQLKAEASASVRPAAVRSPLKTGHDRRFVVAAWLLPAEVTRVEGVGPSDEIVGPLLPAQYRPAPAFVSAANFYFQSFGALSIVKINAAWFNVRERGSFAGIFGIMIQLGRFLAFFVGAQLLARYAWQSAFFVPSVLLLVLFVLLWGYKPFQTVLKAQDIPIKWPGLHNTILRMPPAVARE